MSSSATELRDPVLGSPAKRGPSTGRGWPAVCSRCMEPVDLAEILPAIRRGKRVSHPCGKVLYRGAA
jgi:hypothetical protein